MNQVKKVIPITNGIFSHIDYTFLDFEPSQLDIMFITRCGMRTVSPIVSVLRDDEDSVLTPQQLDSLGSMILKMYKPKWDRVSRLIDLEYDPIHNFSDITTEEISDETNEQNSSKKQNTSSGNKSEVLEKDSTSETQDDFEKNNTGTKTLLHATVDTERVIGESSNTRTDNLKEEISTEDNAESLRTDNLRQEKAVTSSQSAQRTDNLTEIVTGTDDITVTRTDALNRNTTHSGTDSNSESGQNNVFGFNSSVAVGDRTDARESSGTDSFTDSIADTGTQTTVTDDDSSKNTQNTGTQTTVTTGTDSDNTTNTGTVKTEDSDSGSSTRENTGTQSESGTSTKTDTIERNGSDTTTDALKETNSGKRTVTDDVDSTLTTTESSSKTGNESAEKHNKYTRSRTLTRNGNIGNITTQQLMAEEIELWRWNFIEEVLDDVKDFLTIPVYN